MKTLIKKVFNSIGLEVTARNPSKDSLFENFPDLSDAERQIVSTVKPFTMTSVERIVCLINAVSFIADNKISGDIAECGVWRGGSMMTVALTLLARNDTSRELYLYDTFEGMSEPTDFDKSIDGISAKSQMEQAAGKWCYASIEDVRENILSTGYPENKIFLVKGKVEDTIPKTAPANLSLLRLDTDWYESTKHELTHLYPRLSPEGILVIDDYGHWQGARQAVDEYFAEQKRKIYLHRIDYTGRIAVGING
ncbi:MAG TPA: TylF/MycF/NovP-related O-methyltransferase [Pyrinomonadaceae bacterium]|nr:TylF/MycF/NovP-related O-methyltransferase [Pyrinomonadaceae bacterium]